MGVEQVDQRGSSGLEEALRLNLVVHLIIMDNSEFYNFGYTGYQLVQCAWLTNQFEAIFDEKKTKYVPHHCQALKLMW